MVSLGKKKHVKMGPYIAVELSKAEQDWIKYERRLVYSSKLECLKCGTQIPKKSSLYKLAAFLDENCILRVRGRLEQSGFTIDEIYPVILPKQSKFTKLSILKEHNKIYHGGVFETLTKLEISFGFQRVDKL